MKRPPGTFLISRLEDRKAEEISRKIMEETVAKLDALKLEKNAEKAKLEEENKNHREKMRSLLLVMKQEEYNIQNNKQKELLLQKSMEDIIGYMSICDWTMQHEFSRSNFK